MVNTNCYSTEEFENQYTYHGPDLGAIWSQESTSFRLWAPTATGVSIRLYTSGDPSAQDLIQQEPMTPSVAGTWCAQIAGDLHGVYYTYCVTLEGKTVEACDPYARTTGVNGRRAMVLNLASTNPQGWEEDLDPHFGDCVTDAVIYELHIRDLSSDPDSGIRNVGKFLGLTETGTKTPAGVPTGLDHIKSLGITHLHLLPSYDYGSVDEAHLEIPQFNWGYDPVNYNVPEGSYSTDPFHGEIRVKEMKQMIHTLHQNGISVVLDVVYNHVYDAEQFCFNQIVPGYFSRIHDGVYSDGSCCGNDTASERSMVRKYIVDSVKYWADEYHMDGFRFDLVGLLDVDTIREVVTTVHQTHPNVIFYGEGWTMDTKLTKSDIPLAVQTNAHLLPDFAFFSDTLRDLLRGYVFEDTFKGYVAGAPELEPLLKQCFLARPDWCPSPSQSVNYASCHDNMSLFDRLATSAPEATWDERIRMNRLAFAIVATSQGIPFLQAGEEFLRSKPGPDGSFVHNSFNSPDSVNALRWKNLEIPEYQDTFAYYQGLIALRKAHPTFRLSTAEEVSQQVFPLENLEPNVVAFRLRGSVDDPAQGLIVAFNPNKTPTQIPLPQGNWNVVVDGAHAGTETLATVTGQATLEPISAMVLTLEPPLPSSQSKGAHLPILLGGIAAAAAVIGGTATYLAHKKKKG